MVDGLFTFVFFCTHSVQNGEHVQPGVTGSLIFSLIFVFAAHYTIVRSGRGTFLLFLYGGLNQHI